MKIVKNSFIVLLTYFFIINFSVQAIPLKQDILTNEDAKFMKLAIQKANEGIKLGQTPFGACIVKDGKIITCNHNVVWKTTDITAHAEINAIRNACKKLNTIDLTGCVIYSTCEPCPMCFSACHWAMITKIVYGTSIKDAQAVGFNELTVSNEIMKKLGGSPINITGDFLRNESLKLFKQWSSKNSKRVY